MTGKTSEEMRTALRLVMSGMTGRGAAKQAGVREESLYRRPEYKQWKIQEKDRLIGRKSRTTQK